MKNVLLIGLGRFGRHMAQKLRDLNHQVLAIDKDERRVQEAMAYVTNAEIGDATDTALIDALGVEEFDLCVVTMGHDLQASLEITSLLKKRGAPFVLARVARDAHAQFLLACGADEVIYPEKQMAMWAAVRYSSDHIFDFTRLSPQRSHLRFHAPLAGIRHLRNRDPRELDRAHRGRPGRPAEIPPEHTRHSQKRPGDPHAGPRPPVQPGRAHHTAGRRQGRAEVPAVLM